MYLWQVRNLLIESIFDLIKLYKSSLSWMLHDIWYEHMHWHPPFIRQYTNLWLCYRNGPYYLVWPFFNKFWEVYIKHFNVCHMPTGNAYSSGHLVLPNLEPAYVLTVDTGDTCNFFPDLTLLLITGFRRVSVTGVAWTLTLSGIWSCPILDLHTFYYWDQSLHTLSCSGL